MIKKILPILLFLTIPLTACMKWEEPIPEDLDTSGEGLFILCEGNFQYSNSTLSYYDTNTGEAVNEMFYRANGMRLGDVAQSMTIRDTTGWIVVNNSHVIFAVDTKTLRERGRIENLTSPRYMHFITDTKAYVTQLWDNRIFIVNPQRYEITGHITIPDMAMDNGSTEQMVQYGKYVYCTCFSYQNRLIKIDTETDCVVAELTLGIQPQSIVLDSSNKLWVLTNGGYEGSPYGYEAPRLYRINPEHMTVESEFRFKLGDSPCHLQLTASRDTLYWINDDVWRMECSALRLPVKPFIESRNTRYFGLTISPVNGNVYVADAFDYQQRGQLTRYNANGMKISDFYVGVNPSSFCWK